MPDFSTHVIVDTPAAVEPRLLPELTRDARKIIVPVLPSDIDIHACSRIIRDLLLVAKIRREDNRMGVVANRIRRNTLTYQSLIRFLKTLGIPIVATLRDSQNYLRAAEHGIGVHEMKTYIVREDIEEWRPLIEWLEAPPAHAESGGGQSRGSGGRGCQLAADLTRFIGAARDCVRAPPSGFCSSSSQDSRMRSAQFL